MRLHFWRRRGLREFAEAIQPELRALPTPEPDDALLQRILASREAGARVILPEPSAERRPIGRVVAAVAVVAAILLVIVPVVRRTTTPSTDVTSVSSFFGPAAFAQVRATALAPMRSTRPNAIKPAVLEYVRQLRDSTGKATSALTATISITPEDLGGRPAWRVTTLDHQVTGTRQSVAVETVYVARADLRLLHRAVHVAPYSRFQRINIRQQFPGDSVTGRMTTDGPSIGAGRSIAHALPQQYGPYVSDAMAPLLLMSVPLSAQWQGSAALLGWAVRPNDVFVPIALRVVGEERVRVPAGVFDCWRLSIEYGGRRIGYWVRKSDGLGVRLYDDSQATTRGTRELVLRSVR